VNKTTQTVESAGGTFHADNAYLTIDGGRDPARQIDRVPDAAALSRCLA
jgi:hypothetical protein